MVEEFAAARVTELMGTGQSQQAAAELSIQISNLQRQGPGGMQLAQELLYDTRQDFNAAGFGQNLQNVNIQGRFGEPVGTAVFMQTDAGPQQVAMLQFQPGWNPGDPRCDPYAYGLAGMAGGLNLGVRLGNFDLNIGLGGYPPPPLAFYRPQPNWDSSFQVELGRQNIGYGGVQQSLQQYPAGRSSETFVSTSTVVNNYNGGNTINNIQRSGRFSSTTVTETNNVGNKVYAPSTSRTNVYAPATPTTQIEATPTTHPTPRPIIQSGGYQASTGQSQAERTATTPRVNETPQSNAGVIAAQQRQALENQRAAAAREAAQPRVVATPAPAQHEAPRVAPQAKQPEPPPPPPITKKKS